ncbi:MAG TPA: DUF2117 domain-containing protein [Methanosarcinales archaeon]|nr:DUF2117 domain-containing protein [Methanosarcinales archaeon]
MKPDIGVVIHGPEVIDSGGARLVLDALSERYHVTAILGGTMGRTAVLDAFLEDRIDITRRLGLSETIDLLSWTCAVVLLSRGKSVESGIAFGRIAVSRAGDVPIVQIEYQEGAGGDGAGADEGKSVIVPWNDAIGWARSIAEIFGFPILMPPEAQDVTLAHGADGFLRRRIHNVLPGENIRINGIAVGTATSSDVEIVVDVNSGAVVAIAGARMKEHGIEKLGRIDLGRAMVRTGSIRRTQHVPRVGNISLAGRSGGDPGGMRVQNVRVVLIDHDAESSFELAADADLAVTVGDDTTAIAGDILYRLGIPIIGITDMDLDNVLSDANVLSGSVVLRVLPGYDDIVGNMVRDMVFGGAGSVVAESVESIREQVIGIAGERLVEVVRF